MAFKEGKIYDRTANELPARAEVGSPDASSSTGTVEHTSLRDEDGEFSTGALLGRAQQIFSQSSNYLETNIVSKWERNLAHFGGSHARDSRYKAEGFKRSDVFRPKTRAVVKSQEAGLATAMFSTTNLVSVSPQSPANPQQVVSAAISKELLQYRLEHTMPWALTVQGAFQDTKIYNVCISHQYWQLRKVEHMDPAVDAAGEPMYDNDGKRLGEVKHIAREDKLCCDNVPPENFRFDPLCDWRDPAGTSNFVIMIKPMRVSEAEEMMARSGGPWLNKSRADIVSAGRTSGERTRRAREGGERTDPVETQGTSESTTVWAHMNIIRDRGEDWVYWTMGTSCLLSEPMRLMDDNPWLRPGERPFVVGLSSFETHKIYPKGDVEQMYSLQKEINEVANTRLDNVRLAINRRYFLKRGSRIDIQALLRNVPGGGVYMDNPEQDVKEITTPDVTASSYREQEVLAQEMDQLVGGFDAVKSAQDGASPGGIARAGAVASAVQDYGVFLFILTWVVPTLRQLLRLEQFYEMDETIIAVAADKAQAFERFGVDAVTDELLVQELILQVDVGIGTMDPLRKVERLNNGLQVLMGIPSLAARVKPMQVANEIMGALGYKDAERFFESDAEWEEKQAQAEPQPTDIDAKMRELDIRQEDNHLRDERETFKAQYEATLKDLEAEQRERRSAEDRAFAAEKALMDDTTKRDIAAGQLSVKGREVDAKSRKEEAPA